jgi:hypothetical protein
MRFFSLKYLEKPMDTAVMAFELRRFDQVRNSVSSAGAAAHTYTGSLLQAQADNNN